MRKSVGLESEKSRDRGLMERIKIEGLALVSKILKKKYMIFQCDVKWEIKKSSSRPTRLWSWGHIRTGPRASHVKLP